MQKIMAIYDLDVLYTTRFLEYFKKKKDIPFEIIAFTKKESIKEFLLEHHIDILLQGNGPPIDDLPLDHIKNIYHLDEEPVQDKNREGAYIFKYQPVSAVMTNAISIYSKNEALRQSSHNIQSHVISVFSPIPSASKLAFSWSFSFLKSNQRKVLFVPMEYLPHRLLSFLDNTSQSLSEFIYYLKEKHNITSKLNEHLNYRGNLAFLYGLTHGFDLQSLNKEDITIWLEAIKNTDYYTIIFYFCDYTEATQELIRLSETVLIATNGSIYESLILKELERQMERSGQSGLHEKFQWINLMEEEALNQEELSLQELQHSYAWSAAEAYLLQE